MLERMLNLIRSSGTVSPIELGRRMNLDPHMVEVLMEDLQRRGLLRYLDMESSCDNEACGDCPASSGCRTAKPRLWEITQG